MVAPNCAIAQIVLQCPTSRKKSARPVRFLEAAGRIRIDWAARRTLDDDFQEFFEWPEVCVFDGRLNHGLDAVVARDVSRIG